MLGRLILAVVTALAIGIGYQQYFGGNLVIFGQPCHRRFKHPFTYMATKTPYLSEELEVEAAQGDPLMPYHGTRSVLFCMQSSDKIFNST